jgi:hypothetical protein
VDTTGALLRVGVPTRGGTGDRLADDRRTRDGSGAGRPRRGQHQTHPAPWRNPERTTGSPGVPHTSAEERGRSGRSSHTVGAPCRPSGPRRAATRSAHRRSQCRRGRRARGGCRAGPGLPAGHRAAPGALEEPGADNGLPRCAAHIGGRTRQVRPVVAHRRGTVPPQRPSPRRYPLGRTAACRSAGDAPSRPWTTNGPLPRVREGPIRGGAGDLSSGWRSAPCRTRTAGRRW